MLTEVAELDQICALPGYADVEPEVIGAILEAAGKFASEILAPLNRVGDTEGSRLENDVVRTPEGWREAYRQFAEGGWTSLLFDSQYGGQGLPRSGGGCGPGNVGCSQHVFRFVPDADPNSSTSDFTGWHFRTEGTLP